MDQGTGQTLAWADLSAWEKVSDTLYMLHTGQGAAALGLVLGVMALAVPAMGATGVILWWTARKTRPRLRANRPAAQAETILLVGSEGGSTWGFAGALHTALTEAGRRVHTAAMSSFAPDRYAKAQRIIVLAATYGDGDAPASAKGFLDRLSKVRDIPMAVLGFGDHSFPAYCAFARAVQAKAAQAGWRALMPMDTVDRQSPQDFARWGRDLGAVLGLDLTLLHQPAQPDGQSLTLISRRDYGAEVQAPTAILRFALPNLSLWQRLAGFGRFDVGDLLAVLPHGSDLPRLYSLASSRGDGFVEIVVKRQPGGLCSGHLTALKPGDQVRDSVRRNPAFKPGSSRVPLILIGAGTGIGPLAGIVRGNRTGRPVHLVFGMRHSDSDFLYDTEIADWQAKGRLTRLLTAASRGRRPHYRQDALRAEGAEVAELIRGGARVMVCGGRGMAVGVADALTEILAPVGLTPQMLKTQGRYLEDVY
ncbi:Oxidoreductase FAD-binding domain-containing protein [Tropicibacter naphthalenivorans]|uniref:NADPH--hemoprotein reductase n=1 Tax=Tropicibacter naphthalenivorans TaxID=441103 RepID=A0A0N7M0I7_9RHOB|nr:Sulfite reductase [NADPH] flavoprotein alpha-component [Tropicibacter naphthalenivorans]SMC88439.1 Oxidoreductase FAD-binding domain-containing protein [Tropicibacter naphthalenivorans]